jgi:hypothetical protein
LRANSPMSILASAATFQRVAGAPYTSLRPVSS